MKSEGKIIIIIAGMILLFFAYIAHLGICNEPQQKPKSKQVVPHTYVVENKKHDPATTWNWGRESYKLVVSDTLTHKPTTKYVGKHTYICTGVGDTITFYE